MVNMKWSKRSEIRESSHSLKKEKVGM